MVHVMEDICRTLKHPVTFPVRAALLAQSFSQLTWLLQQSDRWLSTQRSQSHQHYLISTAGFSPITHPVIMLCLRKIPVYFILPHLDKCGLCGSMGLVNFALATPVRSRDSGNSSPPSFTGTFTHSSNSATATLLMTLSPYSLEALSALACNQC